MGMANGTPSPHGPHIEQAAVQRTKTTILHQFAIEIEELPGGARQLNVIHPDASVLSLSMDPDFARKLGERLIAPSVEVPRNGLGALH